MHMLEDVNIEVYPISVGDKFSISLAPTLNVDSALDTGHCVQASNALYRTFLQQIWFINIYWIMLHMKIVLAYKWGFFSCRDSKVGTREYYCSIFTNFAYILNNCEM